MRTVEPSDHHPDDSANYMQDDPFEPRLTSRREPRLRACPECGNIRNIYRGREDDRCRRCAGSGHLYRMLTVEEITRSIAEHERNGFRKVAIKRALIRDALLKAEV